MICISLVNKNYDECLEIVRQEELVEVRLDRLDLNLEQVNRLFSASSSLVATCRQGKYADKLRFEYLKQAIASGAAYVDLDLMTNRAFRKELVCLAAENSCEVIISYHNFEETPPLTELTGLAHQCIEKGGDIAKIACQVNTKKDLLNLLSLYDLDYRMIAIGMGDKGKISRLVALFLGAVFTYASWSQGEEAAPGQISRQDMESLISILKKSDTEKQIREY